MIVIIIISICHDCHSPSRRGSQFKHRVVIVIVDSSYEPKNYVLNYLTWNFTEVVINKYILFRQRGHRESDMSYKNIITWAKINQIRLWEPLEIQTIQPKKDMK